MSDFISDCNKNDKINLLQSSRGVQVRRKDKDVMRDMDGDSRPERSPDIKPPREENKKLKRIEKDPDLKDNDSDIKKSSKTENTVRKIFCMLGLIRNQPDYGEREFTNTEEDKMNKKLAKQLIKIAKMIRSSYSADGVVSNDNDGKKYTEKVVKVLYRDLKKMFEKKNHPLELLDNYEDIEFEVNYDYETLPEEPQTWDSPGSPSDVEIGDFNKVDINFYGDVDGTGVMVTVELPKNLVNKMNRVDIPTKVLDYLIENIGD